MYKKIDLLSFDTETLGLDDPNDSFNQIIQFGIVPFTLIIDKKDIKIFELEDVYETYIKCPSYELLIDKLSPWVKENNRQLIDMASFKGITDSQFKEELSNWLSYIKKSVFNGGNLLYLGKSMQSLDSPIMTKHLGWEFMQDWGFNRNKIDVQDIARNLIILGKLKSESASSKSLVKHFNIGDDVDHTVISDSRDMVEIYAELLKLHL